MAKKSLGHVQLQWTCPNCETRNPGPQKLCSNCGDAQPEDVEFHQAAQETLITDEKELAKAKAGPDIHCRYCGTRNPATAKTCSQCGAPTEEGAARKQGQVLGAHRSEPAKKINCPSCETPNEPDAATCVQCGSALTRSQPEAKKPPTSTGHPISTPKPRRQGVSPFGAIRIGILVLFICGAFIAFIYLSQRTEDVRGQVQSVEWTRNLAIEGLVPVTYETWHDEIPAEGIRGICTPKVHHTQPEPAPNADEVCGTPYTIDQGSGFGEVVQDCEYRVYEDFCEYTIDEWREVDQISTSGNDFSPRWPEPAINNDQRVGERDEDYQVSFSTEQGRYSYSVGNETQYQQYQIGSRWILKVNTFNAVVATEPCR
ncbi:MAG: zinc ribbon domain-containing protein [Chloroflexota bacterium]